MADEQPVPAAGAARSQDALDAFFERMGAEGDRLREWVERLLGDDVPPAADAEGRTRPHLAERAP